VTAHLQRMTALAESFPTLRGAPGVAPWKPDRLDRWAAGPTPGSGAKHAARFVLAVANLHRSWRAGPFDAIGAVCAWDHAHRIAFQRWVANPFTP